MKSREMKGGVYKSTLRCMVNMRASSLHKTLELIHAKIKKSSIHQVLVSSCVLFKMFHAIHIRHHLFVPDSVPGGHAFSPRIPAFSNLVIRPACRIFRTP